MSRDKFIYLAKSDGSKKRFLNSFLNNILINGKYYYDSKNDQVNFFYNKTIGTVGKECCYIGLTEVKPDEIDIQDYKKVKTSISEVYKCERIRSYVRSVIMNDGVAVSINVEKIYAAIKAIETKQIRLFSIDWYTLNHKDRTMISGHVDVGNKGLKVENLEYIHEDAMDAHTEAWDKAATQFGKITRFSANDTLFIELVNKSETVDELLKKCDTLGLDINDYIIECSEWFRL